MIQGEKQLLRNRVARMLREMDGPWTSEAEAVARERLLGLDVFRRARIIYGFAPLPTELDWIGDRLPEGKIFAFPKVSEGQVSYHAISSVRDLVPGTFGVREPRSSEEVPPPDLILVPGLAFDMSGNRLGRGAGYFDRILVKLECFRLGICFSKQVVPSVPVDSHDEAVDGILTEEGVSLIGGESVWHPPHEDARAEVPRDRSGK